MNNIQHNHDGNQAALNVQAGILAHINGAGMSPVSPKPLKLTDRHLSAFEPSVQSVQPIWGKLVKVDQGLPEIPTSVLPEPYAEFARELAASTQTPVGMATLLLLAAIATCVQKTWQIAREGTDHSEQLCLWIVCLMETGETKSPVFTETTRPLMQWEEDQKKKFEQQDQEIIAKAKLAKAKARKLEGANGDVDMEQVARDIAQAEVEANQKPPGRQLWTGDVTVEKMQGLLTDNGEKMALLADEAGFLSTLTGMYNNGESNIDVFLQAYSGSPCRIERQGRIVNLKKPALTIGTTIQPSVIKKLAGAKGTKGDLIDKGFFGRAIMIEPLSIVGFRDVRAKRPVKQTTREAYRQAITNLLDIRPNKSDDGAEIPYTIYLSTEAEDLWCDWWQELEDNHGVSDRIYHCISSWTKKAHGLAMRIAGVLHIAKHGIAAKDLAVSASTMRDAIHLCRLLIPHTAKAFSYVGLSATDKMYDDARFVADHIKSNKLAEVTEQEIHKLNRFKNDSKDRTVHAFKTLHSQQVVKKERIESNKNGSARDIWIVNPQFLSE